MRRPFLWPSVGLCFGILAGKFFPGPTLPVFLATLFLLPFIWLSRGKRPFLALFLMAIMGIGILRIHQTLSLPTNHVNYFVSGENWVSLEGKVDSLPLIKEKGRRKIYSFILDSENVVYQKEFFECVGKVQVFLFNPSTEINFGNRVRMRGKLVLPSVPQNPGEFNYRDFLARQGIYALFEGYGPRSIQVLSIHNDWISLPMVFLQRIRESLTQRLDIFFKQPTSSLLKALILGIRKDLPEEFRDDFIKTGTAHLVAISGMNITLVAGSFFLFALWIGIPQKGSALFSLLLATGYVFISGAGIPVVRAGWMSGLFFVGLLLEREKDFLNSLFFAFFMILIFDPSALFQVGFQLSFLCVLSLILFTSFDEVRLLLGTFPVCAAYFNIFSWTSIFANFLAIPLFNLGVLGGLATLLLGSVPFVGSILIGVATLALKAGIAWIHFWAEKRWGYYYLLPPSWTLIALYYFSLGLFFIAQKYARHLPLARALALSLCLGLGACFFLPASHKNFVLDIFSAGQNELLHVEFPKEGHWLINTGRANPSNQARWILCPFLRRAGVNHLAGVFLTDFSARHVGGMATVFNNFSKNALIYPEDRALPKDLDHLLRSKREKRLIKKIVHSEDRVSFQQGEFQVLKVVQGHVFLIIHYEKLTFFLLPTWKPEILESALPEIKKIPSVDVLLLPAGQPSLSYWPEILSTLLPEWVVVPGEKPAWRPIFESLSKEEIPVFPLDKTGALRFEIRGEKLLITAFSPSKLNN